MYCSLASCMLRVSIEACASRIWRAILREREREGRGRGREDGGERKEGERKGGERKEREREDGRRGRRKVEISLR